MFIDGGRVTDLLGLSGLLGLLEGVPGFLALLEGGLVDRSPKILTRSRAPRINRLMPFVNRRMQFVVE